MIATSSNAVECPTERAVLYTLFYFEAFAYPLTAEEIFQYCCDEQLTQGDVLEKLQNLKAQGLVFQYDRYYQSVDDATWLPKRQENNRRADTFLPLARRMASFIGQFPFVRSVCVSGSLSKNSMRPDSDIDFFVITEPGRLWLARTLLVLFKKIFLFNSHKYFCVNYFIDTNHLEIAEKNLFTATETVTLLPMYGAAVFEKFRQANGWAWAQFPHFPLRPTTGVPACKRSWLKKGLEVLFSGKPGDWLDEKSMRLTVGYWKRKFSNLDHHTFQVALKSRRYVSKHHPLHFQQRVLERFEARVRSCEADF